VRKEEKKQPNDDDSLTEREIEHTLAALKRVKALGGFGEVRVVVHQGQIKEVAVMVKERLEK